MADAIRRAFEHEDMKLLLDESSEEYRRSLTPEQRGSGNYGYLKLVLNKPYFAKRDAIDTSLDDFVENLTGEAFIMMLPMAQLTLAGKTLTLTEHTGRMLRLTQAVEWLGASRLGEPLLRGLRAAYDAEDALFDKLPLLAGSAKLTQLAAVMFLQHKIIEKVEDEAGPGAALIVDILLNLIDTDLLESWLTNGRNAAMAEKIVDNYLKDLRRHLQKELDATADELGRLKKIQAKIAAKDALSADDRRFLQGVGSPGSVPSTTVSTPISVPNGNAFNDLQFPREELAKALLNKQSTTAHKAVESLEKRLQVDRAALKQREEMLAPLGARLKRRPTSNAATRFDRELGPGFGGYPALSTLPSKPASWPTDQKLKEKKRSGPAIKNASESLPMNTAGTWMQENNAGCALRVAEGMLRDAPPEALRPIAKKYLASLTPDSEERAATMLDNIGYFSKATWLRGDESITGLPGFDAVSFRDFMAQCGGRARNLVGSDGAVFTGKQIIDAVQTELKAGHQVTISVGRVAKKEDQFTHRVRVEGIAPDGRLSIGDPWTGRSYLVTAADLAEQVHLEPQRFVVVEWKK